jgi:hypothetical protein
VCDKKAVVGIPQLLVADQTFHVWVVVLLLQVFPAFFNRVFGQSWKNKIKNYKINAHKDIAEGRICVTPMTFFGQIFDN